MNNIVFWQAGLLLLLCLSVIGLRIGVIPFKSFGGIFGLSLVASLVIALLVLFAFVTRAYANILHPLLSLVIAVVVVGSVAYLIKQVSSVPRIHDISTNLVDIPQFTQALAMRRAGDNSLAYDKKVSQQQQIAYPELNTLSSSLSFSESVKKSILIAKTLGWEIHFVDEEAGLIEAIDTSLLFGFVDDIVIRLRKIERDDGLITEIDLRSASRVGKSDLGANAKRIKQFSTLLK